MANETVRGKTEEEMPIYKEIVAQADFMRKIHILYFEGIKLSNNWGGCLFAFNNNIAIL